MILNSFDKFLCKFQIQFLCTQFMKRSSTDASSSLLNSTAIYISLGHFHSVSHRRCKLTSPRFFHPLERMGGQKNTTLSGTTASASLYRCCHNVACVSSLAKISAMFAHLRQSFALRSLRKLPSASNLSAVLSCSNLFVTASSMLR